MKTFIEKKKRIISIIFMMAVVFFIRVIHFPMVNFSYDSKLIDIFFVVFFSICLFGMAFILIPFCVGGGFLCFNKIIDATTLVFRKLIARNNIDEKHDFNRSYIVRLAVFYLLITIGAICVSKSNMVNHEAFEFVFGVFIAGTGLLYVYFGVEKSIKLLGCISIISGSLFIFNYF